MKCRYCGQLLQRCPHRRDLLALCQGWRHTTTGIHYCGTIHAPLLAAPGSIALDICEAMDPYDYYEMRAEAIAEGGAA